MRRTGRVGQINLLLTYAALLLLLAAVTWLMPPLAGPTAAQPHEQEEPSPGHGDRLLAGTLVSETISPTTILEMFFSSSAAEWPAESSAAVRTDLEALTSSDALYLEDPVFAWNADGGTYSMDWGDMDRDGDLDLITASDDGVAVYVNRRGNFSLAWSKAHSGLGVRWFDADRDGDSALEAIVVGDGQPTGQGTMAIISQPELSWSPVDTYTVPAQLLRVEPGDFDEVAGIDLVASTNALDPPSGCPVVLFRRQAGDPPYGDTQNPLCVSNQATASLAAADVDDDGDLDLALGLHLSKEIRIVLNNAGTLSTTLTPASTLLVDGSLAHIPYDLAWGDYDGDGWLDLAAAFPLEQEVRIYANNDGTSFTISHTLATDSFLTPLALDWADLDGDGRLELLVADLPPKIYEYDDELSKFTVMDVLPVQTGRIQEIRAIDTDKDADLDVAVANQYAQSELFANTAPLLSTSLFSPSLPGGEGVSVAWGDANDDGYLDLLVGGALYSYDAGSGGFVLDTQISDVAEIGAFGDFNGDGDLDVALGSPEACEVAPGPGWGTPIPLENSENSRGLAWADYDDDGYLDLAVALPSPSRVTVYKGTSASAPDPFPILWSTPADEVEDLAWADYDGDHWLDLAVASATWGVLLYHHKLDGTLEAGPVLDDDCDARSLAWGDGDGDKDLDLAVGCYGKPNLIYENAGSGSWEGPVAVGGTSKTTSLAWGDWDNDGDLDLAVGNYGQKDRVYANQDGTLVSRWESTEILSTTALAWGDWDGDGDLDLAVTASDRSGWYANNYVLPAHLDPAYRPLPRNPSYLSVARPGTTPGAYFYSSPEILSPPESGDAVPVTYTLYDPEGDAVTGATYAYSPDGGGHWIATTNVSGTNWTASTDGITHTLQWDAATDEAVSDNARFRITIVHGKRAGPVQRASTSAISPPFRVRATTCIWPSGLSIRMQPEDPEVGESVEFLGLLEEGSGLITFEWDMGDYETMSGQLIHHRYDQAGIYTVTLTVTGENCPVTRPVVATKTFEVYEARSPGGLTDPLMLYLPLILRQGAAEPP